MRDFFNDLEDYRVSSRFFENENTFTIEEMYQAFKQRLMVELQQEQCTAQQKMAETLESEIYR